MNRGKKIKIFLIAGEPSGDRLGAKLMSEIKFRLAPGSVSFMGLGGELMQAAGLKQIAKQKNFGIIGFLDVVLRFLQLAGLIKLLAEKAKRASPDVLITIDSWDFCSRVVAKIKADGKLKNTRFIHYVSPSVWLYRRSRITRMKLLYDMLLVVFPFEARLYHEANMPCQYIGHHLIEDFASKVSISQFKRKYNIGRDFIILGAMVGSRPSEIVRMLPLFVSSIELFLKESSEKFMVVWPAVDAAAAKLIEATPMRFNRIVVDASKLSNNMRVSMLRSFDLALVKSGTSTLEVALARVPMVVAYKVDCFSALVAKYIFRLDKKLKHVAMVNILLKEEAVKEFVQERCQPSMIARGLHELRNKKTGTRLLLKYQKLAKILSCDEKPSKLAADIVICLLHS
jgi:lipid-A-disaccharide synthase